jgi:hypothetical protein
VVCGESESLATLASVCTTVRRATRLGRVPRWVHQTTANGLVQPDRMVNAASLTCRSANFSGGKGGGGWRPATVPHWRQWSCTWCVAGKYQAPQYLPAGPLPPVLQCGSGPAAVVLVCGGQVPGGYWGSPDSPRRAHRRVRSRLSRRSRCLWAPVFRCWVSPYSGPDSGKPGEPIGGFGAVLRRRGPIGEAHRSRYLWGSSLAGWPSTGAVIALTGCSIIIIRCRLTPDCAPYRSAAEVAEPALPASAGPARQTGPVGRSLDCTVGPVGGPRLRVRASFDSEGSAPKLRRPRGFRQRPESRGRQ